MNKPTQRYAALLLMLFGTSGVLQAQSNWLEKSAFYINTTSVILILGLLAMVLFALWILRQHRKTVVKLQALAQDVDALRQENETLQEFNALAMHDLKSPLRTMTSFTNLFLRRYGSTLTSEGQEFLTYVEEGGKRLERLLDGMPQSGSISLDEHTTVDTNQILRDAMNNLRAEIDQKGAEVSGGEKLPLIVGNYGPVLQLFQNIIGNSLKYVAPGSSPRVSVKVAELLHHYIFAISDNGIGIAVENQEEVFNRHVRLHNGEDYEGSGLGLAHCRQIVERLGGQIWLESEPGVGTTVFFSLPMKERPETARFEYPETQKIMQRLVQRSQAAMF